MRKKGFLILLLSMLILISFGCGKIVEEVPTVEKEKVTVKSNSGLTGDCNITEAHEFSEGLAWIEFENKGITYTGCINDSGDLEFFYEGKFITQPFENDYSSLRSNSDSWVYIVNNTGDIVGSYFYSDGSAGSGIRAWGGGFVLIQEYDSGGFEDESSYRYSIQDINGKEIDYITNENNEHTDMYIQYMGEGVFKLSKWDQSYVAYFISEADKYYEPDSVDLEFKAADGYIIIDYYEGVSEDEVHVVTANTKTGEIINATVPKECRETPEGKQRDIFVIGSSKGEILLKSCDQDMSHTNNDELVDIIYFTYDINNDEFKVYNGKYADVVHVEHAIGLSEFHCIYDGVFAINVDGKDGKRYISLINTDMQEVCEPFRGEAFSIEGGVLTEHDIFSLSYNAIYDLQGNLISSYFPSKPKCFGEGLMVMDDQYYKYNGEVAFSSIDYSKGRKIEIE